MRAAHAADSATSVMVPRSRLHRFTLFASSGPRAVITAPCHSDVSAALRARCAKAGSRAVIRSRAVVGLPGRTVCLSRGGLLGIVLRPLSLAKLPKRSFEGAV